MPQSQITGQPVALSGRDTKTLDCVRHCEVKTHM